MKRIIKEYLSGLKEKDELDLLICDLMLQKNYIMDSLPKTGGRQYGVDIHVYSESEICLFVVKRGNINRKVWCGDQNAVKQSIDEIKSVYLKNLKTGDKDKMIKIIVVTNGMMEDTIRFEWNGNTEEILQFGNYSGYKLELDFWSIDKIADEIYSEQFNEYIFEKKMHSNLRKALYLVEENDYKNIYYEQIIDYYIDSLDSDSLKKFKKNISSLYLISQMMAYYAASVKRYKISIMISEYLIIKYWKYLLTNSKFEDTQCVEWLIKFIQLYNKWNYDYFKEIEKCCYDENLFPKYNQVENRVLLYEVLSFLASYSYFISSFKHSLNEKIKYNDLNKDLLNSIVTLINKNPSFFYPVYDSDIGTINILYRLLDKNSMKDYMVGLLEDQISNVADNYSINKKHPSSIDSFEDALNIEFGYKHEEYETSGMWGSWLEWIAILNMDEFYSYIYDFLNSNFADMTKCVWYFRSEEEFLFYNRYAMNFSGVGVAIELEKNYKDFLKNVLFIRDQFKNEKYSFDEYLFEALEIIVCRYYGYIPRVKLT